MKTTTCFQTLGLFLLATLPVSLRANNAYLMRNLVSDIPNLADYTDAGLKGAWGISASATSPFWIADAGSGLSTLYGSGGNVLPLKVTIPGGTGGQSIPTGTVFNFDSPAFAVAAGKPAAFLFDTLDGTISGWNPQVDGTHAILKVNNSSAGAGYTGLAIGTSNSLPYLYAANFKAGTIDVFDGNFSAVVLGPNAFQDPNLPSGYAPFNIQNLGGKLYVAYAKQNPTKTFAVPGAGLGFVDVFDTAGNLFQRLVASGSLNAPWGLAIAPAGFGDFANDLLVGNFGDGKINVFHPAAGTYLGTLNDLLGTPIVVPNLWALKAGNGGSGGDSNAIYFTAGIPGPDGGTHGLFGRLQAAPQTGTNQVLNGASFQPVIAPNTWVAIQGANLASTTRTWDGGDFVNGALPTTLDGVTAWLNGKPAFMEFVSPKQLNILIPADTLPGPVQLQLVSNGLTSATITVQVQALAPAFFLAADAKHVAATHADGSLVSPPGAKSGTPAKPGETIVLYGTGFGAVNPEIPNGKLVTGALPMKTQPLIKIGGVQADLIFAGLTGPGLYQFNVTIPAATPDGDAQVVAQAEDTSSPGALIPVQH